MNKNLYRIVFNQRRGQLMAVAETAGAQGKSASGETTSPNSFPSRGKAGMGALPLLSGLSLCMGLAMGVLIVTPAQAQIKADITAPRVQQPVILQTASGITQVNIATPSAAGVSRNTYSQFDVQRAGVILNNASANVLTQLGGYAQGNPMLTSGSARVILNEVNSANPSYINGYVEVAGQRAEVIIANPSGINVNGGGFINASRATLTTGTPIINSANGGSLDGYLVQRGIVNISGAGLDASTTDYTGILARAVQVNAGIWAKELKVVAGANQINEAQTNATPTTGTGPAPAFAIDVAQLGGMYAGKITLIGTEAGVGVRNAGVIGATAGDVVVQSNGWLSSISNSGTIYAAGNTALSAQGNITNTSTGLIAALGNTSLAANGPGAQVMTLAGSVLAAGLKADGSLATSGDLSVTSTAAAQLKGQFAAGGGIALTSASLDLTDITLAAQSASLSATTGDIDLSRSTVNTTGAFTASAAQTLRTDGAAVTANQLNITARDLSNIAGQLIQTGTGNTNISLAGNLNNTRGRIATNAQNLTLAAQTLLNTDGKLEHAGTGALSITANTFSGQRGQLTSNGALVMNGGNINLDNASTAAQQVSINAASLSNRQGSITQTGTGATRISTTAGLDNTGGNITSNGNTTITAQTLINQGGTVQSAGISNLSIITQGALDNSAAGRITAGGDVTVAADSLNNNAGSMAAVGALTATATQAVNNTAGQIAANGNVSITASTLTNTGGTLASIQGNLQTTTTGQTSNDSGTLQAALDTTVAANGISNTAGKITGRNVTLTAGTGGINNSQGLISAANNATVQDSAAIKTLAITNTGGSIIAGQLASIHAKSLSGDGKVQSLGDVAIALTADFNNQSEVIANNNLTFSTTGNLTNSGNNAKFEAGNKLSLSANVIDNSATLVGKDVAIKASTRVLNHGTQAFIGASSSTGLLEILAPDIINRDETTATDSAAQTSIIGLGRMVLAGSKDAGGNYTSANSVRNESARIASTGDMTVYANVLTNTRRVLTTSGGYAVQSQFNGTDVWSPGNPDVPGGRYIEPPHGGSMNSDYIYTSYTGTVSGNSISQISPKGVIESGGNFTPIVNVLQNYFSAITAAGNIALNGVTLDQNSWQNGPSGNITPYGQSTEYSGFYLYQTYRGQLWGNAFGPTAPVITALPGYDASFTAGGSISGVGNTLLNTAGINPNTPLGSQSGTAQTAPGAATGRTATTSVGVPTNISLPTGGLFKVTSSPTARYLIETNPAFTNNRLWLSSDFYFVQLGQDPSAIQKRLGDGYYEQQLVREQIMGLTGKAILDYPDAQAQYQALMQAGAAYARQLNLAPGIALSAAQVAQLASDVVILQEVQVAGQTVLTPVVYLSPNKQNRLLTTGLVGPLIAANSIELTGSNSITNNGVINAAQSLSLGSNTDIDSRGGKLQSGGQMQLASLGTIDLTSGQVKAGSLDINAGQRLILNTASAQFTSAVAGGTRQSTQLGQTASIDVTGNASIKTGTDFIQNAGNLNVGGNLNAQIGGNWNLGAVQNTDSINAQTQGGFSNTQVIRQATSGINVGGQTNVQVANNFTAQGANIALSGPATLTAGGNITLSAVKDSIKVDAASSSSDHKEARQSFDEGTRGTSLQTGSNLTLTAGRDITLQAASINSTAGVTRLNAAGSVNIESATERHDSASQHTGSTSGFLSSTTTTQRTSSQQVINIGSAVGGNTVNINAGNDINVKGSSVISDAATNLTAGNNVNIEAATNTSSQTSFYKKEVSGVFSSGGIGLTLGSREQSTDQKGQSTTAAASTVGSIGGNVNIVAGQTFRQVGSDIIAPGGDINILAKKVEIVEARETSNSTTEQKFKQSGLTLAITSPVISAVQTAIQMSQAASNSKDSRTQALAMASSALAARNGLKAIEAGQGSTIDGKEGQIPTKNEDGSTGSRDANAADKSGGINISLSIGSASSQSNSSQSSDSARGSSLAAGNNINITATGAGVDSNLLVQGSSVKAGNTTTLTADNQVNLQAALNTASQTGTSKSSAGSVGISWGTDGLLLNVGASLGRGKSNGQDSAFTNTAITAGNTAIINSGGDTNLKGAVVTANTVKATVGGNLNIESLQDTSTYASSQQSIGGSVSIGYGNMRGSFNAAASKTNSDFASVIETSGIKTGDGGFQVSVNNNTDLKGAVIASTQSAVDNNKNSFSTANQLTTSDIQNTASYSANKTSIGIGTGFANGAASMNGQGIGIGSDKGNASSTTTAGISGIAGNTAVRSTDAQTGIKPIFDAAKVQREIDAQVAVTQYFGQQATKAVGDYAQGKTDEAKALRNQVGQDGISEERKDALNAQAKALEDNWGNTGTLRLLAHTLVGGLTGGASGAAGAAAGTLTAPLVADALRAAGITGPLASTLTALASTAAGALAGGTAGAAAGFNEVVNNYLKHPDVLQLAKKLALCNPADAACKETVVKEAKEISDKNNKELLACGSDQSCVQKNITDYAEGAQSFSLLYAADKTNNNDSKTKTAFGAMSDMQTTGGLLAANLSAGNANAGKWQADNCVALTSAACETKFQAAAQRGELLPKTLLPTLSLGGGLAAMTAFKGPHEYTHTGTVCDGTNSNCTTNSTYNALLQYAGPGSPGNAQVGSGSVSAIGIGPFLLGYVTHLVDPVTQSVVNITMPGAHGLDQGWVARQVGSQPNGITSVNSYGAGTGANPFNINVLGVTPVWGGNVKSDIKPAANLGIAPVNLGISPVNTVLCARFGDCK